MFSSLWANAQQDPPLAFVFLIVALAFAIVVSVSIQVAREAKRSRLLTAAEMKRDQHRIDRMTRLRDQQARFGGRAS